MEPLPETAEALGELLAYGDARVATELARIGSGVQAVVPTCVGVSLSLKTERFTFTLVADSHAALEMDTSQYLDDDGPCIEAVETDETVATSTAGPLDEDRWLLSARAEAAHGVESSLSLPIRGHHGEVVAGVNLYAATADAFDGHHAEIARICRAWTPGVVTNADLSFSTRLEAVATPDRIRDQTAVHQAIGMFAEFKDLDIETAATRLREAAAQAHIAEAQAAQVIIRLLTIK